MKNSFLIILSIFFGCTSAIAASNVSEADIPFIEKSWDASPNYSETKVLHILNRENLVNEIPLTIVILKDSGWELSEVSGKIVRAANIFAQCNINFNPILMIESRSKLGPTVDPKNYRGYFQSSKLESTVALQKPIVYFAKNELDDFSAGGIAWLGNIKDKFPGASNAAMLFRNLAILPENSVDVSVIKKSHYELLAHELAHILVEAGESAEEGHLLSYADYRTNYIRRSDCERIYRKFF